MADNLKGIPFQSECEGKSFPDVAKNLVYNEIVDAGIALGLHPSFSIDEVYVVWFAYTLGNWKALCSTSLPDGRYYEVTRNKGDETVFIDTYVKIKNSERELR